MGLLYHKDHTADSDINVLVQSIYNLLVVIFINYCDKELAVQI